MRRIRLGLPFVALSLLLPAIAITFYRYAVGTPVGEAAPASVATLPASYRRAVRRPVERVQASPAGRAASHSSSTNVTHTQHCALWRVDNGFLSTIHLKNTLVVGPLTVTPILFMADGTEYDLPPVRLVTAGNDDLRVNDALANAPPAIAAHISDYGSVELRYQYPSPGHLQALTEISQAALSLTYGTPFEGPPDAAAGTETVEGLWWRHTPQVNGFVALANTTAAAVPVSLRATGSLGTALAPVAASIPAHATRMFELDALTRDLPEEETRAGGLRLQYQGKPGAIVAAGGLIGEGIGYSANIPFWPHEPAGNSPAAPITYASVGLMVGQPNPMMGFPATLSFTPYAVLENTTARLMTVKMVVNYMSGTNPVSVAFPGQRLNPQETRRLDLAAMLKRAGLASLRGYANLSFTYTGHQGELLVATGSVDPSGNWVFPVEPQGVARSFGKSVGYWTTANAMSSMYTLWNPTNKAQDFRVTLFYGDGLGRYILPVHLAPQASTMIDVGMLKMELTPDAGGNVIPELEEEGGVEISSPKGHAQWMTVVVSAAFYNPHRGTCTCTCVYCNGYSNPEVAANPFTVAVSGNTQLHMQMTYYSGEVDDFTSAANWNSSDTSMATVGNGSTAGLTKGVSPGSMSIYAGLIGIPDYNGDYCSSHPQCPTDNPQGVASGTSLPTVSISGGANVPLRTGSSTGPNSMNLTASGSPSGGTYNWTTSSSKVTLGGATSYTVTVTAVAKSNSIGDVPITVTYKLNGQSGTATTNITVEQPTSLALQSDDPNGTHTCVSGTGNNTCTQSYFSGGSGSYTSYLRTRTYHIMDQFNPPQWIQGYALQIQESYTTPTGQCAGPPVSIGGGSGDTIVDCFYFCSATCQAKGSCSVSSTQTATVNGFNVATESVNWTCSGVTVSP
ncbi:MAG TPA: hypothetical protein VMT20_09225 [Terriglobia bacterium]|nr:hypothetical protein [Terriglobia bacterium]